MIVQRHYCQSARVRPKPWWQSYLGGINLDRIPSCDRNGSRCWTTRDWWIDRARRHVSAERSEVLSQIRAKVLSLDVSAWHHDLNICDQGCAGAEDDW